MSFPANKYLPDGKEIPFCRAFAAEWNFLCARQRVRLKKWTENRYHTEMKIPIYGTARQNGSLPLA